MITEVTVVKMFLNRQESESKSFRKQESRVIFKVQAFRSNHDDYCITLTETVEAFGNKNWILHANFRIKNLAKYLKLKLFLFIFGYLTFVCVTCTAVYIWSQMWCFLIHIFFKWWWKHWGLVSVKCEKNIGDQAWHKARSSSPFCSQIWPNDLQSLKGGIMHITVEKGQ